LQLDPNNALAREGFWEVHRSLDLDALARDKDLLAVVDFDLCLDRAGSLLIAGKPTAAQMQEANRLLEMVLSLRPDFRPAVDYWRAVAHTHLREYDVAARELEQIIDPGHYGPGNAHRQSVLLPAWQLALTLHEELRKRVGQPQLATPGRRMDAIAAVERHLAANPGDANVEPLKRLLYSDITEAEYDTYAGEGGTAPLFDHAYTQHLGLALINDDSRWRRGGEYLRLAARGLPTLGPTIFMEIGKAHQRVGNHDEARHNFELAKRAGKSVGPKNLAEAERQAYFATVKWLGEEAMGRGDLDYAIENIHLCTESERSGLETLRLLAELYERRSKECEARGDNRAASESVLKALRANDMALVYNPRDKDLLERKDRYYYSVMPDVLQSHLEELKAGFDFDYCLRKGRGILENRAMTGPEWLDVAYHLVQLVMVGKPEWLQAKVLLARSMLRFGEREKALALLEKVRTPKPEKFASGEDEDAWFQSCQLLGDLYMELGRPDEAVPCYTDYRRSAKSGARTLYKLGEAHEQLGDRAKAAKYYEQVTAYEGNPLAGDAYEALHRVKGG
jgi:tetratricopeptide (TPR) repeat protein